MIRVIKLWILACAACVCAGWVLSLFDMVNRTGYAIMGLIFLIALAVVYTRRQLKGYQAGERWPHFRWRRFCKPLPGLFLVTAILSAVGGAIYAPNNYDALTYRVSRMLHWWAVGHWHWIVTPNERMNLSGTGFEWLMMPIFTFTHSDRFFFLINIIAYCLLPSLIFLILTACGSSRRVGWFWMWLLPQAMCFAMQAGSISNDAIASTFFLSAIFFALHAKRSGAVRYLWLSFLAAGLLTGDKASNLPLLLPVAFAMWPALPLLRKQVGMSVVVLGVSAMASFLPMAALNYRYTGDWAGDPANREKNKIEKPWAGVLGNGLQLSLQSLEPPFLPIAHAAELWVWDHFPERLQRTLKRNFPRFGVGFREMPQEESSGLGVCMTIMVLISIFTVWRYRKRWTIPTTMIRRKGMIMGGLTCISLMVYMAKMGSEATSRLLAAYYPLLLLPIWLTRAQDYLVRKRWFMGIGVAAASITVLAVILTPSRPLWPAQTSLSWLAERFSHNLFLHRAVRVFYAYDRRNDLLKEFRLAIPPAVHEVGIIEGGDDAESSLWRPYGQRRVIDLFPEDYSKMADIHWVVVKDQIVDRDVSQGFDAWLKRCGGQVKLKTSLIEKVSAGPEDWSLVYVPSESAKVKLEQK